MKNWKSIIYLSLLLTVTSCQNNSPDSKQVDLINDKKELIQIEHQIPYSNFLENLNFKNLSISEKKNRFFYLLIKKYLIIGLELNRILMGLLELQKMVK